MDNLSILHPDRYGGGKFILSLGCGFVNTLLVTFKIIDPGTYEFLIMATVGAYITGASVDGAVSAFANRNQKEPN